MADPITEPPTVPADARTLPTGEREFSIAPSATGDGQTPTIPPDLRVCDDCADEIDDPAGRRYRYPFTNCTRCGRPPPPRRRRLTGASHRAGDAQRVS